MRKELINEIKKEISKIVNEKTKIPLSKEEYFHVCLHLTSNAINGLISNGCTKNETSDLIWNAYMQQFENNLQ